MKKTPTFQPVKPLYKAIVKFAKEKDAQMLFFDVPVHISWNMISGTISIDDGKDKSLFLAHWNVVDYCQIATDGVPAAPLFCDTSKMTEKKDDKGYKTCSGCVFNAFHCENTNHCTKLPNGTLTGYTVNPLSSNFDGDTVQFTEEKK